NATNADGNTALHFAAAPGTGNERITNLRNNKIVELLLAHGARVNAKNKIQQTPLDRVLSCFDCTWGTGDLDRLKPLAARGRDETAALLRKFGATSENVIDELRPQGTDSRGR